MYIHIGSDVALRGSDIVGIFDLDNVTRVKRSREFLNAAERAGLVSMVGDDLPKSFILSERDGRESVILTQIASATLLKRAEQPMGKVQRVGQPAVSVAPPRSF